MWFRPASGVERSLSTYQLLLAPQLVLSLPGQLLLGYYGLHPLSLQPGRLLLRSLPLLLQPHGPLQLLLKLYGTETARNSIDKGVK